MDRSRERERERQPTLFWLQPRISGMRCPSNAARRAARQKMITWPSAVADFLTKRVGGRKRNTERARNGIIAGLDGRKASGKSLPQEPRPIAFRKRSARCTCADATTRAPSQLLAHPHPFSLLFSLVERQGTSPTLSVATRRLQCGCAPGGHPPHHPVRFFFSLGKTRNRKNSCGARDCRFLACPVTCVWPTK